MSRTLRIFTITSMLLFVIFTLLQFATYPVQATTEDESNISTQGHGKPRQKVRDNPSDFINDTGCMFAPFLPFFCKRSDLDEGTTEDPEGTGKEPVITGPVPTPATGIPKDISELEREIKKEFGLIVRGFDEGYLILIYSKMLEVSETRFADLVKKTTIAAAPSGEGSQQLNCRTVKLAQYSNPEFFTVVFIHELAHIIRNCTRPGKKALYDQHLRAFSSEGPLTLYSDRVCGRANTQGNRQSEDYAEMITYYLNPGVSEQTQPNCARPGVIPFAEGANPDHFKVAQDLLGQYP